MLFNKTFRIPFINIIARIRSLFWKRDDSIILFGSWFGEKFADNSRYLYQYLSENKVSLGLTHVVWVTCNKCICNQLSDMGYEAVMMHSKESIYYHKKAKFHIICNSFKTQLRTDSNGDVHIISGDILDDYSYGAIRINLWHGIGGPKAVGFLSNLYKNKKKKHKFIFSFYEYLVHNSIIFQLYFRDRNGWAWCYRIAPSYEERKDICADHGCPEKLCIHTSYPRNCKCPRLLTNEKQVLSRFKDFKTVILYLPTFRNGSLSNQSMDPEKLKKILNNHDVLWIEKPHSAALLDSSPKTYHENIIHLKPDFDINVLMPYISILITDYSSARMDAMYHSKPVFYYVPDFQEYKAGNNGFLKPPEALMCGPILYTVDDLLNCIAKYIHNPNEAKTHNYETIRSKYWDKPKDLCTIWNDILSHIKENPIYP